MLVVVVVVVVLLLLLVVGDGCGIFCGRGGCRVLVVA